MENLTPRQKAQFDKSLAAVRAAHQKLRKDPGSDMKATTQKYHDAQDAFMILCGRFGLPNSVYQAEFGQMAIT